MSKEILNALVDHGVEYVNKILIEDRHKELSPMFHLISRSGKEDAVICTPWGGDLEKKIAVAQVKSMARKIDAQAVCFMTEAWLTKHRVEEPLTPWHARREAQNHPPPSESPERIEIVMIIATNPQNEYASRMLQIVRHKPGGKIVSLVPDADAPNVHYESWMFDGMFRPHE